MGQLYDLKFKPRRPQGLTAAGHNGPRLHQIINRHTPPNRNSNEMTAKPTYGRSAPPKKAPLKGKANAPAKESIDAPLESSSDEDSAADIKPTIFMPRSKSPTPDVKGAKAVARSNKTKATANGMGTRGSRSEKAGVSPRSSRGPSIIKRKSQPQEDNWLGKGMVDAFGRVNTKPKKARTMYGSSQFRLASSQAAPSSKKTAGSPQGLLPLFCLKLGLTDGQPHARAFRSQIS